MGKVLVGKKMEWGVWVRCLLEKMSVYLSVVFLIVCIKEIFNVMQ